MDNILDCDSEVESPVEPSVDVESVGSLPPTSTVTSVSIGKKLPRSSVWNHFNVKADKNDDGSEVKKPDGYFVIEELPFVKVEKPTFHRWIKMAFGPQFKPPCHSTMRSDVMLSFQEEQSALKDILRSVPGKVCLTSDLWTSNQKLGYMCITAHFIIKDWKLHKRVLSFPVLPAPHTGRAISDAMYANLLSWGICDRIGTITLDNASNNDSDVSQLKDKFFGDATLSRELCHLRCTAHVMNLIVKAGLKHVEVSLNNIRESVKHLKSSQ
ncbi:hypothetical protein IFM89_037889, partial [Coptis chinensis]